MTPEREIKHKREIPDLWRVQRQRKDKEMRNYLNNDYVIKSDCHVILCVDQGRGSGRRRTEAVVNDDQDKPYVCDSKCSFHHFHIQGVP